VLSRVPALPAALLLAPLALAQARAPVLSGVVLGGADGKPVKRAEVILRSAGPGIPPLGVTTDENGRFAFFDVRPGQYDLRAMRHGFLPSTYVHRGAVRLPMPFVLEENSPVSELRIRLSPAAALSGKVKHGDADPAIGVTVEAYREYFDRTRHGFQLAGRAATDDRGEYRIYDLPPGRYYVAAILGSFSSLSTDVAENFALDAAGKPAPPERSVTTFFPSAWKMAEAARIEVGPGAEIPNLDIFLARTRTSTLKLRVVNGVDGRPVRGPVITMERPDGEESGFLPARFPTRPAGEGEVEIRGVVPGTYYLRVQAAQNRKLLYARRILTVGLDPEIKLDVLLHGEVIINGVALIEGKEKSQIGPVSVRAEPRSENSPVRTASVKPDGKFELLLLPGEAYDLYIANAPANVYLKEARLDAGDALDSGLVVGSSPPPIPLQLVLAESAAQIVGITDVGSAIMLMPEDARINKFQAVTTDEYGIFRLGNVAPGKYRVLSWLDQMPCQPYDPVQRPACNAHGERISAKPLGMHSIEIRASDSQAWEPSVQ
jgi:hypothetical protein